MRALSLRLFALFLSALLCTACGGEGENAPGNGTVIEVWFHEGQPAEKATIEAQVQRFHEAQSEVRVQLKPLPEGNYNQMLQASMAGGDLPDLLEIDGPYVATYASQNKLAPLGEHIGAELRKELLPSILEQGIYADQLWAVGTFDSGLGIWARRSLLEKAGVRIPKGYEDAWKGPEFGELLEKLAEHDDDGQVLDLGLQLGGEWLSFAFLPLLASAGGEVLEPESGLAIRGLAGPKGMLAFSVLQSWMEAKRVDPNLDGQAFLSGRVALCWGGHWQYTRLHNKWQDDLVLLPLPDFGQGAKTGQGSWCWAIPAGSEKGAAAARFLHFLLETDQVLSMSQANGGVPGTRSAIAKSELHQPGGALALFVEGLDGNAVPRPRSPAYPTITSAFQEAFGNIRDGRPVNVALSRAASQIDAELEKLAEQAEGK